MKKQFVFILFMLLYYSGNLFSQVKFGDNPTSIGGSSLVEMESTTKGFVMPRMNTAQLLAIATPMQGMLVYNTDSNCIAQRTASAWQYLCETGGPNTTIPIDWHITGNLGTVAGTNFIGTIDAVDFVTKTNNTENMRVTSAGNVGIGTTTPGSKLDVKGTIRLSGSASGYVGLQPAAAAGSTTYTLPTADGTSGQQLSTNGAGILSWSNQTGTTSNTLASAANVITSTVNGVAAMANAVNSVANTSSTNSLTTTINGVAGTAVNIINSNATSLSGAILTTTVNGVPSPALDLTPAITSKAWSLTGNSGTVAGTNFIGTIDAIDFVTKTNNNEKMRVTSAGNVGIGTNAPGQKLETMNGNLLINNNNNISGELRIAEPSASGTNYTAFKTQPQAANITYTLPDNTGSPNMKLTTDGTGVLTWSDINVAVFSRKIADESVVNSSTLQDDNDFIFSLNANKTYEVTLMLKVHCSNGGKIKMRMIAPAGSTAFMGAIATKGGNSGVTYMPNPTLAYTIAPAALDENTDIIIIQGTISTSATSGTFKVQWAQDNSDTDPTTVFAGSYCKVTMMQ
jgi:hypothetical protein